MEFKSKCYKTLEDLKQEIPFLAEEELDLARIQANEDAVFAFYILMFF